jgi:hypothetical protein
MGVLRLYDRGGGGFAVGGGGETGMAFEEAT